MLAIDVITIFPKVLNGFLGESMMKRALDSGAASVRVVNLRDYTKDKHRATDDRPYGGGPGMVMLAEPLFKAVEDIRTDSSRVILMTPQGAPFTQEKAGKLAEETHLVFLCGHYEGIDERVREHLATDEISIGDYVLTNGILAAAVVVDAVIRLLPGVVGGEGATSSDSFSNGNGYLEYPQYTRPSEFRGWKVPDVLLSGNHPEVAKWREEQARLRTQKRRPDLLQ